MACANSCDLLFWSVSRNPLFILCHFCVCRLSSQQMDVPGTFITIIGFLANLSLFLWITARTDFALNAVLVQLKFWILARTCQRKLGPEIDGRFQIEFGTLLISTFSFAKISTYRRLPCITTFSRTGPSCHPQEQLGRSSSPSALAMPPCSSSTLVSFNRFKLFFDFWDTFIQYSLHANTEPDHRRNEWNRTLTSLYVTIWMRYTAETRCNCMCLPQGKSANSYAHMYKIPNLSNNFKHALLEPNHALKQKQSSCFQVSEYKAVQSLYSLLYIFSSDSAICTSCFLVYFQSWPRLVDLSCQDTCATIVAREKGFSGELFSQK